MNVFLSGGMHDNWRGVVIDQCDLDDKHSFYDPCAPSRYLPYKCAELARIVRNHVCNICSAW